ncbi:hypothetical protein ACIOYV_21565 [Pseudomonas sp. NPDC087342]|uniref:hypothetical protein n=1 Tax=Pseudomonas sp. NPDC087342 TaxID=3364437 RepID=UPI0037F50705
MLKGLCRFTGVVVLVCSTFSSALRADSSTQVYTGTLGKTPIVLEVNPDTGDGRYFYQKYRKDLVLSGTKEGEVLVLEEGDETQPHPSMRLQPTPDGWSGEWTSAKGKVLKVELQQAKLAPVPADTLPYLVQLHDKWPYEYLRLLGLKLKQGQTENFMGYTLQWWSEPQSKIQLFEVVSGYSGQARERINQQLMARLWRGVAGYFECANDNAATNYDQLSQPMWMTASVMSTVISTDSYCGGSLSDQDNEALNFDAKTGNALTLEDVLWVGQGKPLHFERNYYQDDSSQAWSDYRTEEWTPWLLAQLLRLYPNEMTAKPETEDNDCRYNSEDPWSYPGWYFTEKGIKLAPSYMHSAAACRNTGWSVLPYNLIKQNPGGVTLQLP